MPGYDGTGPKSRGPMTGASRGFCILKIPGAPNEPISGFAGSGGHPVRFSSSGMETELESLHARVRKIETAIRGIKRCVAALEARPSIMRKGGR